MSLHEWQNNGWLKPHKTSPKEIRDLLSVVDREISDAGQPVLSVDGRFTHAYQAALQLCAALLYASGYIASRVSNHYRTIMAMPLVLGDRRKEDAVYLDTCRNKRNEADYRLAGAISEADAKELLDFAKGFRSHVVDWIKKSHPELMT
jgi:uncharacterized protein (UPF0332 family)